MKFEAVADDEIKEVKEFPLLKEGNYDFAVTTAEESTSKVWIDDEGKERGGNEMICLTIKVWGNKGEEHTVWCYLVSTPAAVFRIKNFCEATGLSEKYKAGNLTAADCQGKSGKAFIKVQPATDKFAAKNVIGQFIVPLEEVKTKVKDDDFVDSDIPF